jgi:Ca2+-binding RTX toxin-like protein
MSSLVRLFIALLSVSTVLLVSVPAVEAATVSKTGEEPVITLTYQAAPGERNQVAVTMVPRRPPGIQAWIVSESGLDTSGPLLLTAGPGCTSLTPQIALCEYNVVDASETSRHVVIDLGDDDDFAWASGACGTFELELPFPCQALISGGEGVDVVLANDVDLDWFESDEPSRVYGGPGADHLYAGDGRSPCGCPSTHSRLIGGRGNDRLIGGPGRDMISGGRGEDTLRGGLRADELRGGDGRDTFYARDGYRDRVFGGKGRDSARVDRLLDRVRSIARFF